MERKGVLFGGILVVLAIPSLTVAQPVGIPPIPEPPVNMISGTNPVGAPPTITLPISALPVTVPPVAAPPLTVPPGSLVSGTIGSQNGLRGLNVADGVANPDSAEGRATARANVLMGGDQPQGENASGVPLNVPPAINPFIETPEAPPVLVGIGGNPVGAPPSNLP